MFFSLVCITRPGSTKMEEYWIVSTNGEGRIYIYIYIHIYIYIYLLVSVLIFIPMLVHYYAEYHKVGNYAMYICIYTYIHT